MKHFKNVDELHAHLERQAKRTIKYYYTDWKNYDRPAVMKYTGEKQKEVYIILRESGSYIFTRDDLTNPAGDFSAVCMDYYTTDKTAKYYKIDFYNLTAENIPAGLPRDVKAERAENLRAS